MTQITDPASWAQAATIELRKIAENVATASTPQLLGVEQLEFKKLAETAGAAIDRLTLNGKIDRDRCIYVITLDDDADPEALQNMFVDTKKLSDLKLPQPNHNLSKTMYVGSSCATHKRAGTLRNRLRQHLIKAPKGTYALSLASWASELEGGLLLRAWQYPAAGEGEEGDAMARTIVLAIEDWLSGELKPMLGRRGSRH